ncbi:MAG: ATP-binding protein [Candidatus Nanoarchaeia archaeon]
MKVKTKTVLYVLFVIAVSIVFALFINYYGVNSQEFFIGLTVFVLLTVAVSGVFVYQLLKPIDDLIIAAQLLSAGRYEKSLENKRNDEFGRLISTFNSMSRKFRKTLEKSRHYSDLIAQEKCKTDHIIDSMADGVIVTDENYKVVLFNSTAEQMFRLNEEKVKHKHIIHIFEAFGMKNAINKFPPLDKHQVLPLKDISPTITEQEVQKPKKMILRISIAAVLNEKHFPVGTVTVINDITRLKEIERMKTEFVSNVSHELRTPLTSILGYTTVLLSRKKGEINEKQKKYLETIDRESKRLSGIIEDILDLSKLENRKANLKFENINLKEALESSQAVNFPRKKGIKFEILAPKNLPTVKADRIKVTQVFNNLISNAVKFTPTKGKITVKFSNKKEHVQVDVMDTGVGVKKESLPTLFNKFFQVRSNLTNKDAGTGLGLSIVKEIIASHYGLLGVESKFGKGTRISFTIPKKQAKQETEKINCWEYLSCGKKKCPMYKAEDRDCWIEIGTFCKKGKNEPCLDKIKVCAYCDIYKSLFKEESNA